MTLITKKVCTTKCSLTNSLFYSFYLNCFRENHFESALLKACNNNSEYENRIIDHR